MQRATDRTRNSEGPCDEIAGTLRQIYDLGLTTTSGGNLSVRDADGSIWISPAGIDKGELRPDQVARVNRGPGSIDAASIPPPSSELPFHRAVYAAAPDLRAIVHAHPISLVAFSIAHRVPDTRVWAQAHALCGRVGFARYALPGSRELGSRIADEFAAGFTCVVLENHGVVVGGCSLRQAFERLEALELCARILLEAHIVGKPRPLASDDLMLLDISPRTPSPARPESVDIPDSEHELRHTLCEIARRAHRKRLMTSTLGVLSTRLSNEAFVRTPSSIPLDRLEPADLLRIRYRRSGVFEADDGMDPEEALHAALYRVHPTVGAVVHGCAANTSAFCAAHVPLPTRTIPESYMLVREPGSVSFRATRTDPEAIVDILCPDHPVALVQNEGALVLGTHILDAFDRLEVLEATAAAVIASRSLGDLAVMNEDAIDDLRDAFFPTGGFLGAQSKKPG